MSKKENVLLAAFIAFARDIGVDLTPNYVLVKRRETGEEVTLQQVADFLLTCEKVGQTAVATKFGVTGNPMLPHLYAMATMFNDDLSGGGKRGREKDPVRDAFEKFQPKKGKTTGDHDVNDLICKRIAFAEKFKQMQG